VEYLACPSILESPSEDADNLGMDWAQWLIPVKPATWEAKSVGWWFEASLAKS
jgi:hypothetical protein